MSTSPFLAHVVLPTTHSGLLGLPPHESEMAWALEIRLVVWNGLVFSPGMALSSPPQECPCLLLPSLSWVVRVPKQVLFSPFSLSEREEYHLL